MFIQADDQDYYLDPTLGGPDWLVRVIGDDLTIYVTCKGGWPKARAIANQRIHGWGKVMEYVWKGTMGYPPDWTQDKESYGFRMEFLDVFPVEHLLGKEKAIRVARDFIGSEHYIGFRHSYCVSDVREIYYGTMKSWLFEGLSKREMQAAIQKQLVKAMGIRLKDLEEEGRVLLRKARKNR